MKIPEKTMHQSRRDFFKCLALTGSVLSFIPSTIRSLNKLDFTKSSPSQFNYKYKTISVDHVKELHAWFNKLKSEGKISDNKIFRSYIDNFVFNPEEIMPGAKSIIVLAMPLKIASIRFHKKGEAYDILIPTDYWDDGATLDGIKERVMDDIVKDRSKQLEIRTKLPLKTLAVRSGLAKHGRNNISYVDGYGSFHRLVGLYTDMEFEDNWGPLDMLHFCKGCNLCYLNCPTKAISKNNFVIDVNRCVTLYNERNEPFPDWLDPKSHHTLVGCLKCQWDCPANDEGIKNVVKLGELNEKETEFVLAGIKNEDLHKSIVQKLLKFPYAANLEYFSRNLNAALSNAKPI